MRFTKLIYNLQFVNFSFSIFFVTNTYVFRSGPHADTVKL